jgi:hypothetical protein
MSESNLWSYGLAGTNSENFETCSLPTTRSLLPAQLFYVVDPVISIREQANTNGLPLAAVCLPRRRGAKASYRRLKT